MPALQVLAILGGGQHMHGYAIHLATGIKVSTVYRILERFETEGLARSERERIDPRLSRAVPKVVYKGTTVAVDKLTEIRSLVGA